MWTFPRLLAAASSLLALVGATPAPAAPVEGPRSSSAPATVGSSIRTVELPAQTDTWVMNRTYTSSQSGSTHLGVGTYDGSHVARSFVHFTTAQFTGRRIASARLRLHNYESLTCAGSAIRVAPAQASWSSSTLTWANQPAVDNTRSVATTAAYGYTGCSSAYVYFDVTSTVQRWADGYPNYGLRIAADEETTTTSWRRYRSANYASGDVALEPHLEVTYLPISSSATQFQINPGHSAAQTGESIAPPLRLLWHRQNNLQPYAGSSQGQAPLIVGDLVFSLELQYQATVLSARRLADGSSLWQRVFPLDGYGWGSLAYAGGRLFALHQSRVTAVSPDTGSVLWNSGVYLSTGGLGAATASIVVTGSQAFDAATGRELRRASIGDQWVYGGTLLDDAWYVRSTEHTRRYSLSTGEVVWEQPPAPLSSSEDPVVANGSYAIHTEYANDVNRMYVRRSADGVLVRTLSGSVPPALMNTTAFIGDGRSVSAVDLTTGAKRWSRTDLPEALAMSPVVANGHVYVATGEWDSGPSHLYVLREDTGAVAWSTAAPVPGCGFSLFFSYGNRLPSIAVAGRRVIVPMQCGIAVYGPA
ncbi:DNRLRE domain-containing protein [Micromonospora purpureochromogenes]|uniref:DNRLRE domain-containing protein n=1 Tax=Micromonospora purpureochromogenes TaxID=47872 RepID=UPI000B5AFAB5|nr:DNRLRE domain-containing protein [Micromonospora purpureochromogenes]